jgi:hypothetical protein
MNMRSTARRLLPADVLLPVQQLLSSTILLLVLVALVLLVSFMRKRFVNKYGRRSTGWSNGDDDGGIFVCVYLLLFAYPILSVRIVEAFSWSVHQP